MPKARKSTVAPPLDREKLLVLFNRYRLVVGWSWADTNEWLMAEFATLIPIMRAETLRIALHDLYHLRNFQLWKTRRVQP